MYSDTVTPVKVTLGDTEGGRAIAAPQELDGRRRRSHAHPGPHRRGRGPAVRRARATWRPRSRPSPTPAGVAVQTVYYVFGTKRNLLAAVLDATHRRRRRAGARHRAAVDRRARRRSPTRRRRSELLVEAAVGIVARTAPVYEVVRRAAADPEVGELLADNRRRRRADQRRLVEMLARGRAPAPDLDVDTAADVFYAVVNEEVFQLLVVDCGWDVDRFRELGDGAAGRPARRPLTGPGRSVRTTPPVHPVELRPPMTRLVLPRASSNSTSSSRWVSAIGQLRHDRVIDHARIPGSGERRERPRRGCRFECGRRVYRRRPGRPQR